MLERAAVADLEVDPEVEARNLIAAAVRRELRLSPRDRRSDADPGRRRGPLAAGGAGRPDRRGRSGGGVVARLASSPDGAARPQGTVTSSRRSPDTAIEERPKHRRGAVRRSTASTPPSGPSLLERGRRQGTVHAEEVALVLRHVELTADVSTTSTDALTDEGISSTRRSTTTTTTTPTRRRRRAPRRRRVSPSATTRPTSACSVGGAAAGSDAGRAARRRVDVRRRAHVPARDRPGRPAHHRGRAAPGPARSRPGTGAAERIDEAAGTRRRRRAAPADADRAARRAGQERADPGQPAARRSASPSATRAAACSCST